MPNPTCPAGHPMIISDNKNAWICDSTSEPQGCVHGRASSANVKTEIRWRCSNGCDFDYCGSCVSKKQQKYLGNPDSPRPFCRSGHLMSESSVKGDWFCDASDESQGCVCGPASVETVRNQTRWRCTSGCDFDYCGACVRRKYPGSVIKQYAPPVQFISSLSDFRCKVELALMQVKRLLDINRNPEYAPDVPHKYTDKYRLAEYLTLTALASHLIFLDSIGVTSEQLLTIMEWSVTHSVSLQFLSTEKCSYVKEVQYEVDLNGKLISESSEQGKFSTKVVKTVKKFMWLFELQYEIRIYRGSGDSDTLVILRRSVQETIKTNSKNPPYPQTVINSPKVVTISWVTNHIHRQADNIEPSFSITRAVQSCRTPSHNEDIDGARDFFLSFKNWCSEVRTYFEQNVFHIARNNGTDLSSINATSIFIPVLPIFDDILSREITSTDISVREEDFSESVLAPVADNVMLNPDDVNELIANAQRSLRSNFQKLEYFFPSSSDKLVNLNTAQLLVACHFMYGVIEFYENGIDLIDDMLLKQLVAAVGKIVMPSDFTDYMRFHNHKLFSPMFRPKPFCYSIRRTIAHSPEGSLSVEEMSSNGSLSTPIYTTVNKMESQHNVGYMRFRLNAATTVLFSGERYVHAYISHKFKSKQESESKLCLVANTRQFSGYILMLGQISSADTFDPKFAMIIQNKEEVSIPLDLETIPSAKEFKNSIGSLSPEQQKFATAFRSMQLSSTLFAICIVQIKPQLEILLNLTPDSLTKEIRLTHDLIDLFVTYQISSDLLSFQGPEDAVSEDRIAAVKGHVKSIQDMISSSKERELIEKQLQDRYQIQDTKREEDILLPLNGKSSTKRSLLSGMRAKDSVDNSMSSISPKFKDSTRSDETILIHTMAIGPRPSEIPPTVSNTVSDSSSVVAPLVLEKQESSAYAHNLYSEIFDIDTETISNFSAVHADYTLIPKKLDVEFEEDEELGAVRPIIIHTGAVWRHKSQKRLLGEPVLSLVDINGQKREQTKAFDLLDALSRSGNLSIKYSSLHVFVAVSHSFEETLMDTIIKKNINPIEKIERSTLIMASTIHGRNPTDLVST